MNGRGPPFLSSWGSQEGENLKVMQANSDQRREDFRGLPGLMEKMLRTVGNSTPMPAGTPRSPSALSFRGAPGHRCQAEVPIRSPVGTHREVSMLV